MVHKTNIRLLEETDRKHLMGFVELGPSLNQDKLVVQAIGAGAPTPIERYIYIHI